MTFRKQANCDVMLGEVVDIDPQNGRVVLADGELPYDYLVVATGATHSYFGNDEWEQFAPGLKSISDATGIRRRIYRAFEAADRESDMGVRKRLMTFVVVGGGPTGVELAGTLAEISRHTLKHDFRHINPQDARIMIVEAAEHVLNHLPIELSQRAVDKIRELGIEVLTKTKVTDITEHDVLLQNETGQLKVATETVLWAAGVQANPLGRKLAARCNVEADRSGRVPVGSDLRVQGQDRIFVIGDLASFIDAQGKPLPGVAPVAIQEGRFVASTIVDQLKGKPATNTFKYRDPGTMATIGRTAAVAQIGHRMFSGWFAWILWLVIHLRQIILFQNRLLILMQWMWNFLTFNRSARLIIDDKNGSR